MNLGCATRFWKINLLNIINITQILLELNVFCDKTNCTNNMGAECSYCYTNDLLIFIW